MVPPGTEPSLNRPRSPRLQHARDGSRFGLNPGNICIASGSRSEPANSHSADMQPYLDLKTGKRHSQLSQLTTGQQSNSQAPNEETSPKSGRGNPDHRQSPIIDPNLLTIRPSAKVTPQLFKAIASTIAAPRQHVSQASPSVPRQPVSQPSPSVPRQSQILSHAINYDHNADGTQLPLTDIDDYNNKPPGEFHYEGSDEFEGRDFFDDPEEFGHYKYDPSKDSEAEMDGIIIGAVLDDMIIGAL